MTAYMYNNCIQSVRKGITALNMTAEKGRLSACTENSTNLNLLIGKAHLQVTRVHNSSTHNKTKSQNLDSYNTDQPLFPDDWDPAFGTQNDYW